MFDRDLARVAKTGQIDLFIPADQFGVIEEKEVDLFRSEGDPKSLRAADQNGFRLFIQGPLSAA